MTLWELERKPLLRRTVWKRNGFLLSALALEGAILIFLGCLRIDIRGEGYQILGYGVTLEPFHWKTAVGVGVFVALQLGVGHYQFRKALDSAEMVSLYPQDKSGGHTFAGLKGANIVALVQETARILGVGRIARILLTRRPDPNAYTARVFGLGNIVVLHSNLLDILPRDGIRAVIAHEVGHIRRRDSLIRQLTILPRRFAWVIALLAFLKVAAGLLDADSVGLFLTRAVFFALAMTVTVRAFAVPARLAGLASQQCELIADAAAAHACGWTNHVNTLLLIGERCEALERLSGALRKLAERLGEGLTEEQVLRILNRLPPRELDDERAEEAAPRLYIEEQLDFLREKLCVPLSRGQISHLAAQAVHRLKVKEAAESAPAPDGDGDPPEPPAAAPPLTDWRTFDTDVSGHLDAAETAALVAELRKHPERMLFRTFHGPEPRWSTHPTIRARILFLDDLFAGPR